MAEVIAHLNRDGEPLEQRFGSLVVDEFGRDARPVRRDDETPLAHGKSPRRIGLEISRLTLAPGRGVVPLSPGSGMVGSFLSAAGGGEQAPAISNAVRTRRAIGISHGHEGSWSVSLTARSRGGEVLFLSDALHPGHGGPIQ